MSSGSTAPETLADTADKRAPSEKALDILSSSNMVAGVSPDQALEDIRGYAAANRIRLTGHASQRMQQRGADLRDVRSALTTATTCTEQQNGSWRVGGGVDRDGDELTVIAAIEQGVVVITLF